HPGWLSVESMRPHLDAHMLGTMPGYPSADWLEEHRLRQCSHCSKLLVRGVGGNNMRRRCWAAHVASAHVPRAASSAGDGLGARVHDDLPSLMDICKVHIGTREYLEPCLLAIAEPEFLRRIAKVLQTNVKDAWSFSAIVPDRPEWRCCRQSWTELFMFSKTCLPQLPGGKTKFRRNLNMLIARLERWKSGERRVLWDDRPSNRQSKASQPPTEDHLARRRQETAIAYARQGMPGKAVSRLVDPPLAPDTPEVEQIMRSKFITPPASQMTSHRPLPPPANALCEADVGKAILSFQRGLGSGPSGARPDFLRQVIGEKADKPGLALITRFCNLLADWQAPSGVCPYLAGANGFALEKEAKATRAEAGGTTDASMAPQNGIDARPVCSGEVWRRVVGKALLASERDALLGHLPHQLAVAVPAGQEVLPHLARNWMRTFAQDRDRVLVDYDEGNARNEVDRHTFLTRMGVVVPGISRWQEFIYPTDEATFVFYQGRVIESRAGGQQGCPLIGQSSEVARALAHLSPLMPSLGLRFSRLEAIPAAGASSTLDRDVFLRLGCTINDTQCVSIMKSPVGHQDFCDKTSLKRVSAAVKATNAISQLPDERCALYLLRFQTGRLDYLIRATPAPLIPSSLEVFDVAVRGAFEQAVGIATSDAEWAQTVFCPLGTQVSGCVLPAFMLMLHMLHPMAQRRRDAWISGHNMAWVPPPSSQMRSAASMRGCQIQPNSFHYRLMPPSCPNNSNSQRDLLQQKLANSALRPTLSTSLGLMLSPRLVQAGGSVVPLRGRLTKTFLAMKCTRKLHFSWVSTSMKRVPCAAIALRRWTRKVCILAPVVAVVTSPDDATTSGIFFLVFRAVRASTQSWRRQAYSMKTLS
ncbi:unnamed protein product, partial [Polarella glacialis]